MLSRPLVCSAAGAAPWRWPDDAGGNVTAKGRGCSPSWHHLIWALCPLYPQGDQGLCMQGQRAGPDDGAPVGARRHTVQGGGLEKVARWPVSPRLALCGTGAYFPPPWSPQSASGLGLPFRPVTFGSRGIAVDVMVCHRCPSQEEFW